jgi:hypothetical protein
VGAEPPPPPQVSPDSRFYWDGNRWVPLVEAPVRVFGKTVHSSATDAPTSPTGLQSPIAEPVRLKFSSALALPLSLLIAGALTYAVISGAYAFVCSDYGCQNDYASLLPSGLSLLVVITTVALRRSRAVHWLTTVLCLLLAVVSALQVSLWVGVAYGSNFAHFSNVWYRTPISHLADFWVYGGQAGAGEYWLGWPVGANIELGADIAGALAMLLGAILMIVAIRRSRHRTLSHRSFKGAVAVLAMGAIAIALLVGISVPASAHEAEGFRAVHHLVPIRLKLLRNESTVISTANAQDSQDSLQRAKDLGQGYKNALVAYDNDLARVPFPSWTSAQVSALHTAVTDAVVAALDLSNVTGVIQDLYTALDEAGVRLDAAYRTLYYALLPTAYVTAFPQA